MTEQQTQQYPPGDYITSPGSIFQDPIRKKQVFNYPISYSNGCMQQENNDDTFNMSDLGDKLPKQDSEIMNSNSKSNLNLSSLKLQINNKDDDDTQSKKSMSMEGSLFRQPLGSVGKYKNQKCDFRNYRNNSNNLEYSLGGGEINSGMYLNDGNEFSMHSKRQGQEKSDGMSQMSFDMQGNDIGDSEKKNGNYIQTIGRRQSMKPGTIQEKNILQYQKRHSQILKQSDLSTIQEQQSPDIIRKPLSQQADFTLNQYRVQEDNNNNNNNNNHDLNNNNSDSNTNSNNGSANNEDIGYKDCFYDNVLCDQVNEPEGARNDGSNLIKSDVGGDLQTIYSVNHDKHQFDEIPFQQQPLKNKMRAQTFIAKKSRKKEEEGVHSNNNNNNNEDFNMNVDLAAQSQKRRKTYSSSDVNKVQGYRNSGLGLQAELNQLQDNNIANSQSDSEESSNEQSSPQSRQNRKQQQQLEESGQEGKKRKQVAELDGVNSKQQKYIQQQQQQNQYSHSLSPQKQQKPRNSKKKYSQSIEQNGQQYNQQGNNQELLSLQPVQQQFSNNLDQINEMGQPEFMQYQFAQSMPDSYNMNNTSPLLNNNENLYSTQSSSIMPYKKNSYNSVNTDGNSPLKSQTRKNSNYRKEKRNTSSLYKLAEETSESIQLPYNDCTRSGLQSQSQIDMTTSTQQSQNSRRIKKKQSQAAGRKQKKEHIDTSHAPINIINLLTKHLLKIYKEHIPCESQEICKQIPTQKLTVDQIMNSELCQRCKEQSLIDEIKHSNRKNIENLAKFWQNSVKLQLLSQDYLINNCPLKFVQKNYVDKNRKALIHCLPEFIKGNRRPHEFWKLQ